MSQCVVTVDTANIQHIICPNGGSVGSAQIIQASYINYSWKNVSNGQLYNGGGGYGGTQRNDLDAGLYVITASSPYTSSCPNTIYSDTFEILEATPDFQFNPTQSCPDTCNVEVTNSMQIAITGVSYSSSFDSSPITSLPYIIDNLCGGPHTYEIFANGVGCGVENIAISQFAQMNLSTTVVPESCTQSGSATVNITGVGASGLNTYCLSQPQNMGSLVYSTILDVNLVGDNNTINNPSLCPNTLYSDFTAMMADLTPGNIYTLNIDLGTCNFNGPNGAPQYLIDFAKIYVDWNIDGDFLDTGELIASIPPTQSPSTSALSFTVPGNAIPGQSRMRIVMQNNQYQPTNAADPCDINTAYFGETEDYTIQVNGSIATPISYLWSDGQTSQTATNLSPNTYTITITDANGCTATDTALILSTGTITSSITPTLQSICKNQNSDSLIVTTSGGAGPYQYEWWSYSQGTQSNQAVVLPNQIDSFLIPPTSNVGIEYYFAIVTSAQGCIDTTVIVTVETVSPPTFILQPQDSAVCIGTNFTINIEDTFFVNVASNTITPIYQWYENSTCDTSISGGGVPATGLGNNTATYTPQTTAVGTTYYYCRVVYPQIVDCNTITSECAEIIVNPIPSAILNAIPNPACLGDDIVLTTTSSISVNQYRFMYNNGSGWNNLTTPSWDANNPVIYNNITQATQFRVRVREANGCPVSSWSPTIAVTVNWLPSQTTATSQTACLGGVVPDLFAVGSLPTWYSDQALTTQVYQGNYYATGQTAVGLYTYYVTETWNGCEGPAVPVTLEIYASPVVTATTDQTICDGYAPSSLNASSASSGTYSWVDAADPLGIVLGTGSNFPPPPLTTTTTYTVTFTETSSGCTDDDDVTITVNPLPIITPIWHN